MPAAKQYIALHDFTLRVNDDTGEEKSFAPGEVYDGPTGYTERLLAGEDHHGPLIAAKSSDAAKSAVDSEEN
jgi:hypothetical protein